MIPPGRGRDLSQQPGNPTHALQQAYPQLVAIEDADELKRAAIAIVEPFVGHALSQENFKKFLLNINQAHRRGGVVGIQRFITNYILAGSGLRAEDDEITALATMITEDANIPVRLTPEQEALKAMMESYGYKVALL